MANRTELKARFSAGQRIGESDFTALIDSLAHLSEDVNSGALATGASVSSIQTAMDALTELANQTKSDLDSYMGTHPTLLEVQEADSALSEQLSANLTSQSQLSASVDAALQASIDNLSTQFEDLDQDLTAKWIQTDAIVDGISSIYATKADLNTREATLEGLIANKADEVHQHDQYATKVSLGNFITLEDIPEFAPVQHGHTASEVAGLDDLFMTPAETQALIDANKVELDLEAALYDNFYEKDETDQKFYVARWRTDQVSLFNPTVIEVAQPQINQAKGEAIAYAEEIRVSLFADKTTLNASILSNRQEVDASIATTNSTVSANKLASELQDITLQNNIDTTAQNASASIASSQTHVLSQLASVRAEVLAETESNDTDITALQGRAIDLETRATNLEAKDTSLDEDISGLQSQITNNDTDITALQGRATSLETRATNLEAKDTSLDEDISGLQSQIDTINTTAIGNLSEAKTYTDNSISTLVGGAGEAYDTLIELQNALTSGDNALATELSTKVTNLQEQITGNDTEITELGTRATNLETRATNLEAKDTLLDQDITDLQTQITGNDTDITALQGRATSLETRATNLEAKDTSLDQDIAGLQTQITNNDTDIASNLSLINANLAKIQANETAINTAQASADASATAVSNFQSTYDNLVSSNNALTTAYNALLERVETLENTAYAQAGYVFP